ncbi:MAG: S8 family serine peptidase [Ignavibacteriae bacterium]|nr:S8 family serine peptidase [Ignavibacteriota bacterium]
MIRKNIVILSFVFFLAPLFIYSQSNVIKNGDQYYFSDRIVVKLKSENKVLSKSTNQLLEKFSIENVEKTFANADKENESGRELNKIFTYKFNTIYNPVYISKKISSLPDVEWAEPHYLYELVFEPNDPKYIDGTLNHLERIKAKEAWDVNTGSEDVIIAIVDTGVDWDHPDLVGNIWINPNEIDGNGIDDDGNGFVDDIRGWDFGGLSGTADNNPNEDRPDHGTHVAGISGAVTNNNVGIASIGFNSKIMAVKTSRDDLRSDDGGALIAYGYKGIVYAADNGAKIINLSWGGYSYSIANQEAIDHATSKGALVVAAAGNDNNADAFYPASYKGVLSAVATNSTNDQRASFSNYGNNVDVAAPGVGIYSTWLNDTYSTASGTSMASPLTAGLAALVANEFPSYTPLQIAEQIRANADNIDNINLGFENKLGAGRINAFETLNNKNSKSARINDAIFTDIGNGDGIYESGDEFTIEINCTNYLSSTSNLQVTLESQSSNISIINGSFSAGAIPTLGAFNNSSKKFKIKINDNAASNSDENFLVKFTDGENIGFDWLTLNINPTHRTQRSGNLELTVTSDGAFGFDDYPSNLKGDGLIFDEGENVLFEGALIYGNSSSTIVNTARDSEGGISDEDFVVQTPFTISVPGSFADEEGLTIFNENNDLAIGLGILTKLQTYSFSNEPDDDYIILNYNFYNTTNDTIENFHAGLFCDFDLGSDPENDFVSYDAIYNFGFVYDNDLTSVSPKFALGLVNQGNYNFFAVDNPTHIYDGFSDEEKWDFISGGIANSFPNPSDMSMVISGGPYVIPANQSITVAFVIAGSDSLNELGNIIEQSRNKYVEIPTSINENEIDVPNSFTLFQNYPNPFNPTTTIKYSIPVVDAKFAFTTIKIYDVLGREIATLVNENKSAGKYEVNFDASNLTSGVYYYQLKSGSYSKTKKLILVK